MERKSVFNESRSNAGRSLCKSSKNSYSGSAFERITSAGNLKQGVLPGFLRTSSSVFEKRNAIITRRDLPDFRSVDSITLYLNSYSDPTKILLRLGKIDIRKDDLKCLQSKSITKIIIDASLTVFKHLNSKSVKNKQGKKVLLAKTSFTQKIFNNEDTASNIDFSDCNYLIFPIFVGYWTVLSFNTKELIIHYYDPMRRNKYIKEILKSLLKFLKRQQVLKGPSEQPSFKEIVYQRLLISEGFSEEDSALFALKTIYHLVNNEKAEVTPSELPNFRTDLLKLLFQYGSI